MKVADQLPVKAKPENHGKLLVVPSVEQEDSGTYMCKAKNTLGEIVHYYTVTVEGNHRSQWSCMYSAAVTTDRRLLNTIFTLSIMD